MVFQESLKGLFGLLVFNPSLLLFFLFSLNFVGVESLLLFAQFRKCTVCLDKKNTKENWRSEMMQL